MKRYIIILILAAVFNLILFIAYKLHGFEASMISGLSFLTAYIISKGE